MKKAATTILIISILLLAFGLFIYMHVSTTQAWLRSRQLRAEGMPVTATVIDLNEVRSTRAPNRCDVSFTYTTTATTYTKETSVSSDFCRIFRVGSQVDAHYLNDEPTTADLTWGGYVENNFILLLIMDAIFLVAGVLVGYGTRWNGRINRQNINQLKVNQLPVGQLTLPLTIIPPRGSQLLDLGCTAPFGLLVTLLMGGIMIAPIFNWRQIGLEVSILLFITAAPFLAFGLFLLHISLNDWYRTFTFTIDYIDIDHWLRPSRRYTPKQLTNITIHKHKSKGASYTFTLNLHFDDEQHITIQKSNFNYNGDTPPPELSQLQSYLKQSYHLH